MPVPVLSLPKRFSCRCVANLIGLRVCVSVCARTCICACVCVIEREREFVCWRQRENILELLSAFNVPSQLEGELSLGMKVNNTHRVQCLLISKQALLQTAVLLQSANVITKSNMCTVMNLFYSLDQAFTVVDFFFLLCFSLLCF